MGEKAKGGGRRGCIETLALYKTEYSINIDFFFSLSNPGGKMNYGKWEKNNQRFHQNIIIKTLKKFEEKKFKLSSIY